MHRAIINAPQGLQVDHRDGDGLNNLRSNLRVVTNGQNQQNTRPRRNNKSGYKGVRPSGNGTWQVKVQHTYLGTFADVKDAARAYDAKAKELFGEYARLNFPEENCNV